MTEPLHESPEDSNRERTTHNYFSLISGFVHDSPGISIKLLWRVEILTEPHGPKNLMIFVKCDQMDMQKVVIWSGG
jgi:hypothetical protein